MVKKAEIILEYQNIINEPPVPPKALFQQACAVDESTIDHWQHIWVANATANKQLFGSFADKSVSSEFKKYQYQPCIVAGSGPSLKNNIAELKNRGNIPLVSCLHNFHYMEDHDVKPEYYVTLDAGPVTIEEVSEGGSKTPDEYWDLTKDRTLIAATMTHPDLLKKWQGRILFYTCPIPRDSVQDKLNEVEPFKVVMSTGGNVLGACLYFSKAVLGCHQTIFVGADFSFGYDHKFHSWSSKYDADMGTCLKATDIYGVRVNTWGTYWGFKSYFDSVALSTPGVYYNCSEGGLLGAYPTGNLSAFRYMDLKDCLFQFNMQDELADNILNSNHEPIKLLYK